MCGVLAWSSVSLAQGARVLERMPGFVVDVADMMLSSHVDEVPAARIFDACAEAMAGSLDRHGYYAGPRERERLERMVDAGLGLGIVLAPVVHGSQFRVEIVRVDRASRAAAAGLGVGDRVLAIDGREVHDLRRGIDIQLRLAELADRKGRPTVPITVVGGGRSRPETVHLAWRESEGAHTVRARLLEHEGRTVFWITISEFVRGTGHAFQQELQRLRVWAGSRAPAGVVLDLRGNPGGRIDDALIVADAFVSSGLLATTRGRAGRVLREERAHAVTAEPDLPVVVLQNRYTASAAELLTMALRDRGRAISMGERSLGKGTVQELRGLANGGMLALTIARYHGPEGQMIDGRGLAPDIPMHVHRSLAHRRRTGGFAERSKASGADLREAWKADAMLRRALDRLVSGR